MSKNRPIGLFMVVDEWLDRRLEAATELGITTAQILAPGAEERTPVETRNLLRKFENAGVVISAVFCGFKGESYADIPTVQKTIGLVPRETRAERIEEVKSISTYAKALNVPVTALHIGFIPENNQYSDYQELIRVTQDLCDHCSLMGQRLHLETGQETAKALLRFIHDVGRVNLAINFDPANMILYGSGEPLEALQLLSEHIKSVHCKDAKWAAKPGMEWGMEVPLGTGDVKMEKFLQTLKKIGYSGPLTIEREISGEKQIQDIKQAVTLLEKLRYKMWGGD